MWRNDQKRPMSSMVKNQKVIKRVTKDHEKSSNQSFYKHHKSSIFPFATSKRHALVTLFAKKIKQKSQIIIHSTWLIWMKCQFHWKSHVKTGQVTPGLPPGNSIVFWVESVLLDDFITLSWSYCRKAKFINLTRYKTLLDCTKNKL